VRIRTDLLTAADLRECAPPGVTVQTGTRTSARQRAYAFEGVRLRTGHGDRWPRDPDGTRPTYDRGDVAAHGCATYDEHGEWMARLFERDPRAIVYGLVKYDGRDGFHEATGDRYARTYDLADRRYADTEAGS
jgi:hypothetical protein